MHIDISRNSFSCSADSERCTFDKLVLSDELDSTTQCGGSTIELPPAMEFKGKKVQIGFSSDDDIPGAGFQLKYNITRLEQGTKRKFKAVSKGYSI